MNLFKVFNFIEKLNINVKIKFFKGFDLLIYKLVMCWYVLIEVSLIN